MIRHIIFDFDGTLVDTAPLITSTMMTTISELNLPGRSLDECRATIGLRLVDIPATLWPDRPGLGEIYADTYRRIFDRQKLQIPVKCFPGVIETLRELHSRGFGMAIASSRSHHSLAEYCTEFGLDDVFTCLTGGDDVTNGKPAPDPVLTICRHTGWLPADTLVVGDAIFDIEMGHNAGTETCAVTYGNQTARQLATASPGAMIDHFPALLNVLK